MEEEIKWRMEGLAEDLDELPMAESYAERAKEDYEWAKEEAKGAQIGGEKWRVEQDNRVAWREAESRWRRLEERVAQATSEFKGLFGGVGNLTSWDGFTVLVLEGDEYLVNGVVVELGEAFLDAIA